MTGKDYIEHRINTGDRFLVSLHKDSRELIALLLEQYAALRQPPVMPSLPLDKTLRLDQPYSLPEILKRLIEAADILLHKKDYDGHGWEEMEYAYRHAKDIVKVFDDNEA